MSIGLTLNTSPKIRGEEVLNCTEADFIAKDSVDISKGLLVKKVTLLEGCEWTMDNLYLPSQSVRQSGKHSDLKQEWQWNHPWWQRGGGGFWFTLGVGRERRERKEWGSSRFFAASAGTWHTPSFLVAVGDGHGTALLSYHDTVQLILNYVINI